MSLASTIMSTPVASSHYANAYKMCPYCSSYHHNASDVVRHLRRIHRTADEDIRKLDIFKEAEDDRARKAISDASRVPDELADGEALAVLPGRSAFSFKCIVRPIHCLFLLISGMATLGHLCCEVDV